MESDQHEQKEILVGYDRSALSKEALILDRKRAVAFGATVDVLTSMEEGIGNQQEEIEKAERGLEWAKSLLTDKD